MKNLIAIGLLLGCFQYMNAQAPNEYPTAKEVAQKLCKCGKEPYAEVAKSKDLREKDPVAYNNLLEKAAQKTLIAAGGASYIDNIFRKIPTQAKQERYHKDLFDALQAECPEIHKAMSSAK
jgi:hypothetical protein